MRVFHCRVLWILLFRKCLGRVVFEPAWVSASFIIFCIVWWKMGCQTGNMRNSWNGSGSGTHFSLRSIPSKAKNKHNNYFLYQRPSWDKCDHRFRVLSCLIISEHEQYYPRTSLYMFFWTIESYLLSFTYMWSSIKGKCNLHSRPQKDRKVMYHHSTRILHFDLRLLWWLLHVCNVGTYRILNGHFR